MSEVIELGLPDVQMGSNSRGIALEAVGVSGLRYPITVALPDGSRQQTTADAELTVPLEAHLRGTHMSRFVEALHERRDEISPLGVLALARDVSARLGGHGALARLRFPLSVDRPAPITRKPALMLLDCSIAARVDPDTSEVEIGLRAPVTALCPCSKEIADYSAHSQRGYVNIIVADGSWGIGKRGMWPHDLLSVCDTASSAPIYPLLKRPDERYVTMRAYDRPAFVEDLARDVASALRVDDRVRAYSVEVSNQESIHDHQAVARTAWRRS
jgi:GTP cyclohydrolase I